MDRFNGKENLGNMNNITVIVDWDKLFRFRGERTSYEQFERNIGRLLMLLGVVGVVVSSLVILSLGRFPLTYVITDTAPFSLLFWFSCLLAVYASYLLRNRDRFAYSLADPNLYELVAKLAAGSGLPSNLEISDYMENRLVDTLDQVQYAHPEQFMTKLLDLMWEDQVSQQVLLRLGVLTPEFKQSLLAGTMVQRLEAYHQALFLGSLYVAIESGAKLINLYHLLIVLLGDVWQQKLLEAGVTAEDFSGVKTWLSNKEKYKKYMRLWREKAIFKPQGTVNRAYTSVYTANLNLYSEDYTLAAATGRFELMAGREQEVDALVNALRNMSAGAILLVAKPGIGKTRLLRNLAVRMVVEDVPPELKDKRMVAFDFNRAFSENQSLDAFKSVILAVMEEVAASKDIVLVLEDIEQILEARDEIAAEVMGLLANTINKYHVQLIATVTEEGYAKHIQTNATFVSAFTIQNLPEPTVQISQQILIDDLPELERQFGIRAEFVAIKTLATLAIKFDQDRAMPGKGLKLLEDIFIAAQNQGLDSINSQFVSDHISGLVGVNVGSLSADESEKLINIEAKMHERVIGQHAAVTAVASALRRSRAGLGKTNKPVASFMFYGPTGVGKTEVAKTLAEVYYGDEKAMVRIDMSEYQEEENVSRLIGTQENGEFSGGYLTEPVRANPFTLLLLDELEKANPKVLDLFLQVLDDGFLTDGMGRKIDFTSSIIIATSNAASKQIADGIIQGLQYEQVYNQTLPELRKVYRVEFLNRFDKVIMFKSLSQEEVGQIAEKFLEGITARLKEKGINIVFGEQVKSQLAVMGYDPVYGARELGRVIQEQAENRLADMIITGQLTSGRTVIMNSLEDIQLG